LPSAPSRSQRSQYKVELTVRNHTTLTRPTIIQEIARCVPEGHTVNLQNPEIFILVEVFKASICFFLFCWALCRCIATGASMSKTAQFALSVATQSVCGISIVEDYYKLRKFNVSEISNAGKVRQGQFWPGEGRLGKEQ
jgi:tRNA acetyltransferase TAN1